LIEVYNTPCIEFVLFIYLKFKKNNFIYLLRNFLLKNEKIVIGDFGVSKALEDNNSANTFRQGSVPYMSPEMFTYPTTNISLKTDIW
jgi:serine/threonine protein kinase